MEVINLGRRVRRIVRRVSRATRRTVSRAWEYSGGDIVDDIGKFAGDTITGGAITQKELAKDAEAQADEERKRLEALEEQRKAEESFNRETAGLQDQLAQEQQMGAVASYTPEQADFSRALMDDEEETDKLLRAFRR